ncbi:MAG: hypothetical protein QOK23_2578 [Gammaproteobacteria bacterium]|jgi:hypothetical protein|nr:hypothetical protein [Gammaproteobacteria bacterium]
MSKRARRRVSDSVRTELESMIAKFGEVAVVAHSFGAYLITNILLWNPHIRVRHLILCGAVTDARWPLNRIRSQIQGRLINHASRRDIWPSVAELISRRYKASGVYGISMSDKEERFHNCLHSDYLRDDYLTKFYLPELRGAEISCADPGLPMSRSNRALGWTISHKQALKTAFILGAATIGVLYSLRPAPLCDALFHCSMTISRIEYYPSAECVGDHRAYKANWITLNTYDFYLPRYRFKWVPQGPECDDPEATRLNQCRLQPKVYDSLSPDRDVKPTPQEGNMEYPISVRGGYSSYVADFHTEAGLTPTALGFSTPYVTKMSICRFYLMISRTKRRLRKGSRSEASSCVQKMRRNVARATYLGETMFSVPGYIYSLALHSAILSRSRIGSSHATRPPGRQASRRTHQTHGVLSLRDSPDGPASSAS